MLLPYTVSVAGDGRSYDQAFALRAVTSNRWHDGECYLLENAISTPLVGRSTRQSMQRAAVHTVKNIFYSRGGKEPPARFVVG